MKLLAGLGLAMAGGTAFGGLVYVATPFVEGPGVATPWASSGTPGGRFVGYYLDGQGAALSLEQDGSYGLRLSSDTLVEGQWRLEDDRVLLEDGERRQRVLTPGGLAGALTLRGDGLDLWRSELVEICQYGDE